MTIDEELKKAKEMSYLASKQSDLSYCRYAAYSVYLSANSVARFAADLSAHYTARSAVDFKQEQLKQVELIKEML